MIGTVSDDDASKLKDVWRNLTVRYTCLGQIVFTRIRDLQMIILTPVKAKPSIHPSSIPNTIDHEITEEVLGENNDTMEKDLSVPTIEKRDIMLKDQSYYKCGECDKELKTVDLI